MNNNRSIWLIILGVGCALILCIGVLVVVAASFLVYNQSTTSQSTAEAVVAITVEVIEATEAVSPSDEATLPMPTETFLPTAQPTVAEPTVTPSPTLEPTMPEPTESGPALTGNQQINEYSLFDDFSSEALGWPVYDDGMTLLEYEDEAYHIHILESEYYDWAYIPANFIPYEIWFDVQGPSDSQEGTFGVFCHFQDADNYYFVEFDLAGSSYYIGQIINGEFILLTPENPDTNDWQLTNEIITPPTSVNRIGVSCYMESLMLTINDQFVDEVSVDQVFDQPGEAAFFVYTFDTAGEQGYQVWIDNVEAYEPQQ